MGGGPAATGKVRLRAVAATLAAIVAAPGRRPALLDNICPNGNNAIRVAAQYQQLKTGDGLPENKSDSERSQASGIIP
jgi:hypothetical protein